MNWKAFEGTYLNSAQLSLIQQYEKAGGASQRAAMLKEAGREVAETLVRLLGSIKQVEHLKYVLVLIDEIFEGMGSDGRAARVRHFLELRHGNETLPFEPFLSLLDMQDAFVQYLAAQQSGVLLFHLQHLARETDVGNAAAHTFCYVIIFFTTTCIDVVLRWVVSTLRKTAEESDRPSVCIVLSLSLFRVALLFLFVFSPIHY